MAPSPAGKRAGVRDQKQGFPLLGPSRPFAESVRKEEILFAPLIPTLSQREAIFPWVYGKFMDRLLCFAPILSHLQ
jgi:hypothetical protein